MTEQHLPDPATIMWEFTVETVKHLNDLLQLLTHAPHSAAAWTKTLRSLYPDGGQLPPDIDKTHAQSWIAGNSDRDGLKQMALIWDMAASVATQNPAVQTKLDQFEQHLRNHYPAPMQSHDSMLASGVKKTDAIGVVQERMRQQITSTPTAPGVAAADLKQIQAAAKSFRGPLGASPSTGRHGLFHHVPTQRQQALKFRSMSQVIKRSYPVAKPRLTAAHVLRSIKQKLGSLVNKQPATKATIIQQTQPTLSSFKLTTGRRLKPRTTAQRARIQRARHAPKI